MYIKICDLPEDFIRNSYAECTWNASVVIYILARHCNLLRLSWLVGLYWPVCFHGKEFQKTSCTSVFVFFWWRIPERPCLSEECPILIHGNLTCEKHVAMNMVSQSISRLLAWRRHLGIFFLACPTLENFSMASAKEAHKVSSSLCLA